MTAAAELLERKLGEVTFAILDTETTGLSAAKGERICEVAILTARGGRELGLYEALVNPERPIDPASQKVHGITDAMVADKPIFSWVAGQVYDLLLDKVMVCHNAPFDTGFLAAEFERAGMPMPEVPVVDTLSLARRHFKFPRNNLGAIADALDVRSDGRHRAGNDVRILHGIFRKLLAAPKLKALKSLKELIEL